MDTFLCHKKLLIVDDEPELLTLVADVLRGDGFTRVITAGSMREGMEAVRHEAPELAILDVMLPDGDGFSLMRRLRAVSDMPVIFLTARDEAADRLAGLGLGADDYITKPFLPGELLLRVYAVLRRCYRQEASLIELEDCTVDLSRAEVARGDERIALTAKEHALLTVLARNQGRIVTMDALCEALWGDNPFGYENSLNAHMRRVREKIERNPSRPVSLVTIKGLGYRLHVRK